jgi:lysophospholipase L1-like esterase
LKNTLPRFRFLLKLTTLGVCLLAGAVARAADGPAAAATATATTAENPAPAAKSNTAVIPVPQRVEDKLPQNAINGFNTRHATYSAQAKAGGIDLLFVGDSITQGWPTTGKTVWEKYYGAMKAAQFGVGYDRTQHVLWRLQNGEGQGLQPKVVELLIGTNNLGPNTSAETVAGITAVVAELRKDFPNAKILLLGIFPRGNPGEKAWNQVIEVNQQVAKLDDQQHVFYLDIGPKFLAADGTIAPGMMGDAAKLHPSAQGYEVWAAATKDILAKLLAN